MSSIIQKGIKELREEDPLTFVIKFLNYVLPFGKAIGTIGSVVSKNENIVLCGTQSGWGYQDNSRHLYEWILHNEEELDPIWMTHHNEVYNRLDRKDYPVAKIYSFRGIILGIKASVVCFTHSESDVVFDPEVIRKPTKKIYLAHGNPVKTNPQQRKEIQSKREKYNRFDYITTQSKFMRENKLRRTAFNDDLSDLSPSWKEKFIVTGYPRNDNLYVTEEKVEEKWSNFTNGIEYDKVVLYAPTRRKHGYTCNYDDYESPVKFFPFDDYRHTLLRETLESNSILLLLHLHPSDRHRMQNTSLPAYQKLRDKIDGICNNSKHIRTTTELNVRDTSEILPFIDILITDYSSIYHTFLQFDRPCMFIPYDYKRFKQEKGFVYDYYEHLPGPAISSFEEFQEEIRRLANGVDEHREKRKELATKIHKFQDDSSAERVAKLIKYILHGDEVPTSIELE